MRVKTTPEGLTIAATSLPAERVAQLEQGAPLMVSEMTRLYLEAGADLSAPLVERIAA